MISLDLNAHREACSEQNCTNVSVGELNTTGFINNRQLFCDQHISGIKIVFGFVSSLCGNEWKLNLYDEKYMSDFKPIRKSWKI